MFADRIQDPWLVGACKKERPVTLNDGVTTLGQFASSLIMEPTLLKHLTAIARYSEIEIVAGTPSSRSATVCQNRKGPGWNPPSGAQEQCVAVMAPGRESDSSPW
ncbi:hypothetical protein HRbin28_01500 [bacterium HR28]|nr:hypothetical protein HRbin28_01500 [bacterium HR28]